MLVVLVLLGRVGGCDVKLSLVRIGANPRLILLPLLTPLPLLAVAAMGSCASSTGVMCSGIKFTCSKLGRRSRTSAGTKSDTLLRLRSRLNMLDLSSSGLGAWFSRRPFRSEDSVRKGWYEGRRCSGGSLLRAFRLVIQYAMAVAMRQRNMKPKTPVTMMEPVLHDLSGVGVSVGVGVG